MRLPLRITFKGMDRSEAVEAAVKERAEKLDRFCDDIMGCRVVVEAAHRRHHQGKLYDVRIDITMPKEEIVVNREPGLDHAHEDVYVAVRDAFDAARRRLEDYVRRRRRNVKIHEEMPRGRIARLEPAMDCGFIETDDGREIYFHRNSVVDGDFDRLEPGYRVRFHEETGVKGPQASTVHVEGSSRTGRREGAAG